MCIASPQIPAAMTSGHVRTAQILFRYAYGPLLNETHLRALTATRQEMGQRVLERGLWLRMGERENTSNHGGGRISALTRMA